ncbi:hypothetical protein CR513_02537, partial [Mucuna pruriens]
MNGYNFHEEQALKVAQDEASTGRGRGRNVFRGGVTRGRGRGRGGRQPIDRATIPCYYCHEFGHCQSECLKKPQDSKANYVEGGEEVVLLMAQHSTNDNSNAQKMLFIDSGCSNHMTSRKDWLSSINSSFSDEVKLGNNYVLKKEEFQDPFGLKLIFGYIGFVHVPDQKRSKLDDKSTKYVLGVSEKAYKLYDPINEKIHLSRDVKFQENVAWDWGEAKTSRILDANELNPMEESCQAVEEVIQTSLNDAAITTSTIVPNSTSNLFDLSLRGVEVPAEGRARIPLA